MDPRVEVERDAKRGVRQGKRRGRLNLPSENTGPDTGSTKKPLREKVEKEASIRELVIGDLTFGIEE